MFDQRYSDNEVSRRDIPSFIEPRPPLIQNPFMRPRPQKGTNLLELFEDSEIEEPELVQVYLRLKPCKVPNTLYEVRSEKCLVTSLDTATAGHGRRTQHNVSKMYTFSKIFGADCNQKEIFDAVVKDNLRKLPDGQNFTLLTYGASGSGKTYTLMGTVGAPGLVPRSLEYVFRLVDAAQQPAFRPAESGAERLGHFEQDYELQWVKRLRHVSAPLRDKYRRMSVQLHTDLTVSSIDLSNRVRHYVWVSFVEIYNEAVYDLLAPPEKRTKLRIREDTTGNVYVKGATQAFVRSGEEAYDVMVAGKHNLVVAATGVHAQSSRSHCIFTITMLTETGDGVRTSYVRLCDLAGCERARATRNTGARMQESRAINSSLHVLERCLHMLRRKQKRGNDAMVPYRESKLTRLLGTGLSGARGEAVSMVVTLNPSPEYAHETKHVLSLAAVAQDIQINNTMMVSTFESSTQDTTITSSAEVMKLRSDNERLHFELVQAQARNKELMAAMEERQQESANTMREVVEEAKDMTKQYYEARLEALRSEMEDMAEEYESRLAQMTATSSGAGTPSRLLQSKVAQLMTDIAVLEEQLTVERLARSRAEKELEHLRTCIEERDEKAFKDITPPSEDVMSLSDSENESEEETNDPFNESLEPIFRKELNKSLAIQNEKRDTASVHTIDNIEEEECDTDHEKSPQTIKKYDYKTANHASAEDEDSDSAKKGEETIKTIENDVSESEKFDESVKSANVTYENEKTYNDSLNNEHVSMTNENEITYDKNQEQLNNDAKRISNDNINDLSVDDDIQFKNESNKNTKLDLRGTYFVSDSKVLEKEQFDEISKEKKTNSFRGTYFVKDPMTDASNSTESNTKDSLAKVFKEPLIKDTSKLEMELLDNVQETAFSKMIKQKSNIDMKIPENIVSKVTRAKTNLDMKMPEKMTETFVSKIFRSLKSSNASDNSLRQFEQLEQAAKECKDDVKENQSVLGNTKTRTYFDDVTANSNIQKLNSKVSPAKEKRIYFDNINVNVEVSKKRVHELIKRNYERSPSIVKDVVTDNFEPSTIKKLLGESFSKPDVLSSIHKTKITKKHDSVDIFDGFDSPLAPKMKDYVDNIEIARKSIEKLVLDQQSAKKHALVECEPNLSIREDIEPVNENIQTGNENIQIDIKKEIKLEPMSSVEEFNDTKSEIKKETKLEPVSSIDEPNQTMNEVRANDKVDNTMEEFENIYKDITAPRATEFELLVSQEVNESTDKTKEETKYNLRKKQSKSDDNKVNKSKDEEILAESQAKCESKGRKRPLRLRRRKNQDEESDEKLKDIVNLQSEFSDVTMDVQPAPRKEVKDIPSPEKAEEENLPPLFEIQSCPSKSVTRSRRKLFTPRAEPLEESLSQTGDSNERIYVPRPSYHRPRARRKL